VCVYDIVIKGYDHFQTGACKGKLFPQEEWGGAGGEEWGGGGGEDEDFAAGLEEEEEEEEEDRERDLMQQVWRFQAGR